MTGASKWTKSTQIYLNRSKLEQNRIGVQRLVVIPSKLWRFEWSRGGTTEIKEKSRLKIGNFYDMIFMTKNSIELSYY